MIKHTPDSPDSINRCMKNLMQYMKGALNCVIQQAAGEMGWTYILCICQTSLSLADCLLCCCSLWFWQDHLIVFLWSKPCALITEQSGFSWGLDKVRRIFHHWLLGMSCTLFEILESNVVLVQCSKAWHACLLKKKKPTEFLLYLILNGPKISCYNNLLSRGAEWQFT